MKRKTELNPQVIRGIKDLDNSILKGYAYESPWCQIIILAFPKKATKKEIKRYLERHYIENWREYGVTPGAQYEQWVRINKNHVYILKFYDC